MNKLIIILIIVCYNILQAKKLLRVPLDIPKENNYIKTTIYLGTFLKPFEVNLEINS